MGKEEGRKRDESFDEEQREESFSRSSDQLSSFSLPLFSSSLSTSFAAHLTAPMEKTADVAQWQSTGLVNQGSRDHSSVSAIFFVFFWQRGGREGWRRQKRKRLVAFFFFFLLYSLSLPPLSLSLPFPPPPPAPIRIPGAAASSAATTAEVESRPTSLGVLE